MGITDASHASGICDSVARVANREVAMGLMSALKGLFGAGGTAGADGDGAAAGAPITYGDYTIRPAPERTASGWNTAGLISKIINGEVREHHFIRVDSHGSRDDALAFSITKAQLIIDQLGDRLFNQPH